MRIDLDMPVSCVDGALGDIADVVIDPRARRLTHLVIQARDAHGGARLTPIRLARSSEQSEGVSLECTVASITQSMPVDESLYLQMGEFPTGGEDWDVGIQQLYALPEYGSLGPETMGAGMELEYDQHVQVSFHRIPKGDIEIRRASAVTSSDDHHLGHAVGFVIDDEGQITWLVLEHGHLWGKRMVAIPGPAIDRFEQDELVLSLTSDEVGAIKPLAGHRWGS